MLPTVAFLSLTAFASSVFSVDQCPDVKACYHGGQRQFLETDIKKFPRCWVKERNQIWGCYNPINNSCDNINGRRMIDIYNCQNGSTPQQRNCPGRMDMCYHGNDSRYPEYNRANFPACWNWEGNRWGCYNPVNDSCANINGRYMVDTRQC